MKKIISLAFALVMVLLLLFPLVANAELISHQVTTGSAYDNKVHGDDHNVFVAQGIYWAFESEYFCTSSDMGVTWSGRTDISAGNVTFSGYHITLAACTDLSGTYVYVATDCYWAGNTAGAFRRGELHGNGTISWTDWSYITGWYVSGYDSGINVNIAVDGTGHYWIGHTKYIAYTTNTSYGYIIGSSTTDGTWTTDAAKTLTCYSVGGWVGGTVMPVGLSSTALVLYSSNNGYIYGRKWQTGSATWSTAVHSVGTCRSYIDGGITEGQSYFSAVPYMDRWAQIVYNRSSDNYLIETYFDSISPGLFAASEYETIIQTATSTSTWPCISISSYSDNLFVWWIGTPAANHLYYKSRNASLIWSSITDLGAESAGFYDTWHISAIGIAGEDTMAVIYRVVGNSLRFDRLYGNETGSLPYGLALDPGNVTGSSATFNGLCTWSGGSGANATFVWQGTGIEAQTVVYGNVSTSEYFSIDIYTLIPDTHYWYWIVFTNDGGSYWSNIKHFISWFEEEPSLPIVQTLAASHVTNSGAWLNGFLAYDGNLDTFCGFKWRVHDGSTWTTVWWSSGNWPWGAVPNSSGTTFSGVLSGLTVHTEYDYKAIAKNALCPTSPYVEGNVTTFTTGYSPEVTATPGGGLIPSGLIPPGWGVWFSGLAGSAKTVMGVLLNVLGMAFAGWQFRKSEKIALLVAAAVGFALFVVFIVISWYPLWVVFAVGVIVAVIGLLVVVAR